MGDVEVDGSRLPVHQRERLPVLEGVERELLVPATEPAAENGSQRGAAQGEFTLGAVISKATPARPLFFVEPRNGVRLALLMGRQVDMHDENIVYFTERVKPGIEGVSSHGNQSFRECGSRRLRALKPEASP